MFNKCFSLEILESSVVLGCVLWMTRILGLHLWPSFPLLDRFCNIDVVAVLSMINSKLQWKRLQCRFSEGFAITVYLWCSPVFFLFILVLLLCSTVVSTIASPQMLHHLATAFLYSICMFSQCLRGFSPGTNCFSDIIDCGFIVLFLAFQPVHSFFAHCSPECNQSLVTHDWSVLLSLEVESFQ